MSLVAALFAQGCAAVTGGPPLQPLGAAAPPASQAATTALLYAGGPNANAVDVYPEFAKNPNPVGTIVTGLNAPTGIAVDASGNLYVCNNRAGLGAAGKTLFWTVTVYKRGQSTPFRIYSREVWDPVDVTVAGDGTVYIANISSAVTVYPPGSTDPSQQLQGPSGYAPLGLATDAAGNVFVSYVGQSSGGVVYEYSPGSTSGKSLGLNLSGTPHGLAIDRQGNLVVAVSNAPNPGSAIEVFAPGAKQPKTTMLGPFQPFMLAFGRKEHRLFAADYGSGNNDGGVFVYSYPDGTLLFEDTQGTAAGAYGVAADPRSPPQR